MQLHHGAPPAQLQQDVHMVLVLEETMETHHIGVAEGVMDVNLHCHLIGVREGGEGGGGGREGVREGGGREGGEGGGEGGGHDRCAGE